MISVVLLTFSCTLSKEAVPFRRGVSDAEPSGVIPPVPAKARDGIKEQAIELETVPMPRLHEVDKEDAIDPLQTLWRRLSQLEQGGLDRIRILQFGDSHTAADLFTTAFRRTLQRRFGDAGRGFILLGHPWRTYLPRDIGIESTGSWTTRRVLIAADPATLDGMYGLSGISVESSGDVASSVVRTVDDGEFGNRASRFEVFYLVQPGGGHFTVRVDGRTKGTLSTAGESYRTGIYSIVMDEGPRECEVRTLGDGPVRLFGAVMENEGPGVVVDTLGVNGGFFYTIHQWDEEILRQQVAHRQPDLLITLYGTNEVNSRTLTADGYRDSVRESMRRLRAGFSTAACLMVGPPDREMDSAQAERMTWIQDAQREVAREIGCAFLNLQEMMGGPGTHRQWQRISPALARPDGIHLTAAGYAQLGEQVARGLLNAFDTQRK